MTRAHEIHVLAHKGDLGSPTGESPQIGVALAGNNQLPYLYILIGVFLFDGWKSWFPAAMPGWLDPEARALQKLFRASEIRLNHDRERTDILTYPNIIAPGGPRSGPEGASKSVHHAYLKLAPSVTM